MFTQACLLEYIMVNTVLIRSALVSTTEYGQNICIHRDEKILSDSPSYLELCLKVLIITAADNILTFFMYFLDKIWLAISCESSA